MDNPISQMTDATRNSVIESLRTLELDWYHTDKMASEMFSILTAAVLEENWRGLYNFLQETRNSAVSLRQSSKEFNIDDSRD